MAGGWQGPADDRLRLMVEAAPVAPGDGDDDFAAATDEGDRTVIALDRGTLPLLGVREAALGADDVLF